MDPTLISFAVFGAVAMLVGAVAVVVKGLQSSSTEERLEVLTGRKVAESKDASPSVTKQELIRESVGGITGILGSLGQRIENLRWLFEQADSPIRPDAFVGLTAGCIVTGVVGAWAARSPVPMYPIAGLLGGVCPLGWLMLRRRKRFNRFAKQLPDALELIGRALRSGHSLASGLHVVVEEMPAPVAQEFGMAYEEQNLGVPLEEALKHMLKRMPNMDLKFFVTAVAIQRQAGGDLAEILDKIGYIVRERFRILGQVQALTGEGRISGVVLMLLPLALFLAVYNLNPPYVMLLFEDPVGQKMIAFAAVMQVFGAIAIKKIVNIKI